MASADGNGNGDSGSKDRATVALVDAKVDGLKDLIRAEFANVKEDVKALAAVVSDVIKQGVQLEDHERRLEALETDANRHREWKRVSLPSLILGGVGAAGVIYSILSNLHI